MSKAKKELSNATRASVAQEMGKPRMARSARIAELNLDATRMHYNKPKMWGLIRSKHEKFFFHRNDCRVDSLGRQSWVENIGTEVEFTKGSGGKNGLSAAVDVHLYNPFEEPVDPEYREVSTIVRWVYKLQCGYVCRPCGEWASFNASDILTTGLEILGEGVQLYHGIGFRGKFDPKAPLTRHLDGKDVVKCTNIEICIPTASVLDLNRVQLPFVDQGAVAELA